MTGAEIEQTIAAFVDCAALAAAAGYDGVEVMGSEGYLITQFLTLRANRRDDDWGGTLARRMRLAEAIVRGIRARLGAGFIIMYRISALDLVEGGLTADEVVTVAQAMQAAGADILNTGFGWHEAPVPTIAYPVPRAAFRFAFARLKRAVSIPVVASNRINTPALAEEILAAGDADMVSMARPLLADPHFVRKARAGLPQTINVCIACNQACLDFIFSDRIATCLVNPRACRETEFADGPAGRSLRVAVIGSGPAGLAAATTAAMRGHAVDLFERATRIGGQINLALAVPGKQEFNELLRYYTDLISRHGVRLHLGADPAPAALLGYDRIVTATGIVPRRPDLPGADHKMVVSYLDVLGGRAAVGRRVAIIGAGGIGHDVAEALTAAHPGPETVAEFCGFWGIDTGREATGGLAAPAAAPAGRQVTILQRSPGRVGARLGRSTGWIHRSRLKRRGVAGIAGCIYTGVDDRGLHYILDGRRSLLEVDTIVICAGQEPDRTLADALAGHGRTADVIGGARVATELDAMRAIDEGTRLAWSF